MPRETRFKSAGLRYAYDRYIGKDTRRAAAFDEELAGAEIASQVYDLRKKAGISQRELAVRVGTTASVICRLEDADYEGHSLSMLRRIAAALGKRVEIRFVPVRRRRAAA
jgi:ribosome-binding protein aMBF1 (putative translation factor)